MNRSGIVSAAFGAFVILLLASSDGRATVLTMDGRDQATAENTTASTPGKIEQRTARALAEGERLSRQQGRSEEKGTTFQDPNGYLKTVKKAQEAATKERVLKVDHAAQMAGPDDGPTESTGNRFQIPTFDGVTASYDWLVAATDMTGFDPAKLLTKSDDRVPVASRSVGAASGATAKATEGGFGVQIPALIVLMGLAVMGACMMMMRQGR